MLKFIVVAHFWRAIWLNLLVEANILTFRIRTLAAFIYGTWPGAISH